MKEQEFAEIFEGAGVQENMAKKAAWAICETFGGCAIYIAAPSKALRNAEILRLRYKEGVSVLAIAEQMHMTPSRVCQICAGAGN